MPLDPYRGQRSFSFFVDHCFDRPFRAITVVYENLFVKSCGITEIVSILGPNSLRESKITEDLMRQSICGRRVNLGTPHPMLTMPLLKANNSQNAENKAPGQLTTHWKATCILLS